jgi:hypothetical protein
MESVTNLALDPPEDPTFYESNGVDQLVLYIARVPGSRDVFLSPLRPGEKTVTVEDISGSLYYLHANMESDAIPEERAAPALQMKAEVPLPPPPPPPPPPLPPPEHKYRGSTSFWTKVSPTAESLGFSSFIKRKELQPEKSSMMPSPRRKEVPQQQLAPLGPNGLPMTIKRKPVPKVSTPLSIRPDVANDWNSSKENYGARRQSMMHSPLSTLPAAPNIWNGDNEIQQNRRYSKPTSPLANYADAGQSWNRNTVNIQNRRYSHTPSVLASRTNFANDWNRSDTDVQNRRYSQPSASHLSNRPENVKDWNRSTTEFSNKGFSQPAKAPNHPNYPNPPLSPPYPEHEVFPDVDNYRPRSNPPTPISIVNGRRSSKNPLSSPTGNVVASLTLIRRDPVSGKQWNVAQIPNPSASGIYQTGQSVGITIETPGYKKFMEPTSMVSSFQRQLILDNSKLSLANLNHQRTFSDDSIVFQNPFGSRSNINLGQSLHVSSGSSVNLLGPAPKRDKRQTGYYFFSPWNGRCEFMSTITNSLKCMHTLGSTLLSSQPPAPIEVSELRFNLPAPGVIASQKSEEKFQPPEPRRSRFFGKWKKRINSWDRDYAATRRESEPNMRSTLDLSLGQELAGGGFSGQQAKMGKLIIQKEGMPMLDLLVAANICLWWRAYEKERSNSVHTNLSNMSFVFP